MEEARRVLKRLARIETLDRDGTPAPELLRELRELVREAEAWARVEGGPVRAAGALDRCRSALVQREPEEVVPLAR